jgi:hypothetical protein
MLASRVRIDTIVKNLYHPAKRFHQPAMIITAAL